MEKKGHDIVGDSPAFIDPRVHGGPYSRSFSGAGAGHDFCAFIYLHLYQKLAVLDRAGGHDAISISENNDGGRSHRTF